MYNYLPYKQRQYMSVSSNLENYKKFLINNTVLFLHNFTHKSVLSTSNKTTINPLHYVVAGWLFSY